ncbi:class I SAM-dependent methyltransferase [Petropleomorpha daqingensis]|uniref:SAM-dependent methyltransferase n=1 Tax=Petropleomorpha daqingensis TaxID=2026353 RepID=A0A853CE19_9ACTN|nr:class I SAM-dependent methyltransferase [Petropleomorpha daqingensis]NYJ06054.1 SAM-dependent methyltransferase [Petropleomorpha daqingensis]
MSGTGSLEPASWDSRRTSFGSVAAQYAALRPSYPDDAVRFLLGETPRRVLDLGAGTGLLTERLVAAGHEVVAVDPSAEMLAQLAARLPDVVLHVGAAEQIPLPDGEVDAVVAGQAAHWFDPASAAPEIARLLRPGGVLGLIWNARDERVPWVAALGELLSDEERGHEADQTVVQRFAHVLGATDECREFTIVQTVEPEQVVAGIATRSYAAIMDADRLDRFLGRIRDLLATHPDTRGRTRLELPYVTAAHRLVPA